MSIKNNIYNLFGGGGRAIIFLLTIPLMVNYMGVELFGIWALITSVGNFALFLDVGIASTTMHYVSEIKANESEGSVNHEMNKTLPILFFINTFFSLTILIAFVFFTEELASFFLSPGLINSDLLLALKGIGAYSSVVLMQHFFSGILQAHNQFLKVNIIKFFNILTLNLGLLLFSKLKESFYVLTFYMLIVSVIVLLIYIYLASRKINFMKIKIVFNLEKLKEILYYSLSTWLAYLGGVLFAQLDKIIVGKVCSPEVVGIYAAIISITSYISSIATVGLQPIIPKLTELWLSFSKKKALFLSEYKLANQFNVYIIVLMSLVLLLFHEFLLTNIMNIDLESYPQAKLGFQMAIIIYAFNSLSVPGFYTLMAIKKTKYLGRWQIVGALLALFLIYFLGKEFVLYGVVLGNLGLLLTLLFNFIVSNVLMSKRFVWLNYIYKPVLIFIVSIILIMYTTNIYIKILEVLLSLSLLSVWFFSENEYILNYIVKYLSKNDRNG